jgi:hypothetical protein
MVALEILVNGHHIRTVTVGDVCMLNTDIMWHCTPGRSGVLEEECRVMITGLAGNDGDSVHWPDVPCTVGDSITVRIVNTDRPGDEPESRKTMAELEAAHQSRNSD